MANFANDETWGIPVIHIMRGNRTRSRQRAEATTWGLEGTPSRPRSRPATRRTRSRRSTPRHRAAGGRIRANSAALRQPTVEASIRWPDDAARRARNRVSAALAQGADRAILIRWTDALDLGPARDDARHVGATVLTARAVAS